MTIFNSTLNLLVFMNYHVYLVYLKFTLVCEINSKSTASNLLTSSKIEHTFKLLGTTSDETIIWCKNLKGSVCQLKKTLISFGSFWVPVWNLYVLTYLNKKLQGLKMTPIKSLSFVISTISYKDNLKQPNLKNTLLFIMTSMKI